MKQQPWESNSTGAALEAQHIAAPLRGLRRASCSSAAPRAHLCPEARQPWGSLHCCSSAMFRPIADDGLWQGSSSEVSPMTALLLGTNERAERQSRKMPCAAPLTSAANSSSRQALLWVQNGCLAHRRKDRTQAVSFPSFPSLTHTPTPTPGPPPSLPLLLRLPGAQLPGLQQWRAPGGGQRKRRVRGHQHARLRGGQEGAHAHWRVQRHR